MSNSLYVTKLQDLKKIEAILGTQYYVKDCFVFGSLSKFCISESSDIDLIIIGTRDKDIQTVSNLSGLLDRDCTSEIDLKYYNYNEFKKLVVADPLLLSVEKDCKNWRS